METDVQRIKREERGDSNSLPRNLLGSKEFFFFGSEAVEAKALEAYKKAQKSAEGALDNISWAAHTGKGLLFSGDKKAPSNVINLVRSAPANANAATI